MASQPQSLHPPLPCASGGAGLAAGSPEKGSPRPKPPVRPKPRVLPKPAVPAKPCLPHPPPAPRHSRPELPSAEKINRLAGPQPYSGGGSGAALRRPSFTIKSPETPNGKGLPSPPVLTPEDSCSTPSDEVPLAPSTPSRKGPAPFKVTPVPVATKLERFPGTTVEEILAKMDSKEGLGSPDRARLSPFCPDSSSRFGSKTFTAFRRRPSGEADGDSPGEARQLLQQAEGELGTGGDRCLMVETSSSSPAGPSCAGDPCGLRRPPSPPDLSSLQLGPPGSPRPPACPPPGAPFQPSASAPGSPDAPPELLAPGSPTMAPESPESPAQRPTEELLATSIQAPGAPSSVAEPWLGASHSPGSPHTPSEGSPTPASPSTPGTSQLSPKATCPPGSPESATEPSPPPSPPPELPARASCPPGSPGGPDDSLVSSQTPEGPDFSLPPSNRDSGLRRSSEGVLRPPPSEGQGMGLLGGSLGALPQPGDLPAEHLLSGESSWSLSQSFEWTFPTRGVRGLPSPPRSPIQEAADSGLSEEDESDREGAATGSHGDSGDTDGPGLAVTSSWGAEGAPCPGGPVAQQEAESSEEEEEEGEAELDSTELHIVEPSLDSAEPEPPVKAAPPDPAPTEADASCEPTGDFPASLQGLGGPGQDEGSSKGPDAHTDPRWLTELLASPRARASGRDPLNTEEQEGLLGWSRKDLCSEFGIGRSHQAGAFDWSHKAVARQGDWPGEMEQDQKFRTNSSRNNSCGISDMNQQDRAFGAAERDWSSNYKGTELMGDTRLGSSDWSKSHGAGESCLQDQDFSKPTWGTGYGLDSAGSREEVGSGKAEWSSPYSVGHGQQQDKELSSRQPGWAGKYGSGDLETHSGDAAPVWSSEYGTGDADIKDREVTPDWASKYSSRDAETKDKDFTLGWAGRSSTGDAGTLDKEFCSSRSAWDSKYSTRDMESQDREFSPSRPAWSGEYSTQDMESQDREFSPSRLAEASEYSSRDMEIQDREFSPSRPACAEEHSTSDMESQDREFSTSRPTWHREYSSRDMESQDREFSPSRPACTNEYSTSDAETQDREFNPSRPTWHSEYSSRDMETQDREFSPSRPACADEYITKNMESQDREFSPNRPAEASEYSARDVETQDRELKSNKPAWDDEYITKNMESRDREFGPSRSVWASDYDSMNTEKGEFSSSRLSWAGECSIGQTQLANAFGVRKEDLPGLCAPSRPGQESSWGSTDQQESGTRDWAEELHLGGAEHQNQFGIIGTERVSDPSSTAASADGLMSWANKMRSEVPQEPRQPLGDWHSDLSFSTSGITGKADEGEPSQMAWDEGLAAVGSSAQPQQAKVEEPGWSQDLEEAGWSEELREAEARRQEWASAFGARCAARSQDFSAGEQSLGGDGGSADGNPENIHLSESSPPLGDDAVAEPAAAEPIWGESATPRTDPMEQQDLPELAAAPLPAEAAGETPETESEEAPLDSPDGKTPVSWEEKRLSVSASQPEGLLDLSGQDFTFLEDTEVLDSTMYRSKANLGRKRRHRAPVLRPGATSEGDSWIFQDSTEPRPARAAASSDEEAAEEPKSRRVRASPSGKGVKVPLFPGLTTSALKAKLRGRNRSVEEGASPVDSKATPTKDPHVQRSKSCKIPGLSGKPLALPPKPEKSSGSDASPPHWLQALKLKKKKS
ncbi:182 kDa tankyrase-1-binding protein isoform X1 [Gallus gallus]|uniref:182 kDa tankyrase-1-binding protein isoform X1 n=1 Tax=Gallus gallus TaxID=9031 RepID=UPI00035052ED|nr:182 kDa tankyrase-1-binding protein isoform X1 [Gallus gallus]XP_040557691.1 182 kDa tankyrase-1-binding protein isoform X1 [Gallus gallus]XP_040557692.1 182 kDa tankyrase-1-binding protein isoform X1 [Gallus gallus]XP_421067.4 182 kDa tankyrase-1-binding protein isoform X1 [Gallus gallus]|eukprot:XP_421067.4 182 kDa tankyrase-1-binding protein isoform X3 [Gallus gallus]